MEELPEDITSEERNRLDRAFDSVLERYKTRPATPADNRRLQMALTDALRRAERGTARQRRSAPPDRASRTDRGFQRFSGDLTCTGA